MTGPARTPPSPALRIDAVTRLFAMGVTLLFVVLLGRVVQLQAAPGAQLASHIARRTSTASLQSPRGDLYDRRGRVLSTSRFGYRVIVDPERLPDEPGGVIIALSDALGLEPDQVGAKIMSRMIVNDTRRARTPDAVDSDPLDELVRAVERRLGLEPAAPGETAPGGDQPASKLIRYVPLGGEVDLAHAKRIEALSLPGVWLERRPMREYPGGDAAASIVGKAGLRDASLDQFGLMGAERMLDSRLRESDGKASYVRDAWGRPLWVERGAWNAGVSGESVRLSIDLELQHIALEELRRGMDEADAAGGRIVILNPNTGEVLAMGDLLRDVPDAQPFPWLELDEQTQTWASPHAELARDVRDRPRYITLLPDPARDVHPALGRNRCVEDLYEPGSTFKPFVWSAGWEAGLIDAEEILEHERNLYKTQCGRTVEDVTFRNRLTWNDVLKFSSNIGMARLSERMSAAQLRGAVLRFGFGSRTDLGLPGESTGLVTSAKSWSLYSQTYVSIGHEIGVTPVQMVRAFSAFARSGELAGTLPRLTLVADEGDASRAGVIVRVLPPEVAITTRSGMLGVADRLDEKLKRTFPDDPTPRYTMFGKSGTAQIPCVPPPGKKRPPGATGYFQRQYNSSFIAAAPASEPELVVLVVIDDPGPSRVRVRAHYGSSVAGPVVRRVIERSLTYMGVPPDHQPGSAGNGIIAGALTEAPAN